MEFAEAFDAVLMLTWSDWHTEPRSNRYHYATRFARSVPVLFVQHRSRQIDGIEVETTEVPNLDLVHVRCGMRPDEAASLRRLLAARGIRRPLVWIYDPLHYQNLLDALPRHFRVYHATEDYLTESAAWGHQAQVEPEAIRRMLSQVDFMVAVTQGVARSFVVKGGYKGRYVVAENGCDVDFFSAIADANAVAPSARIALFQGGINARLDYDLLLQVVRAMPEWEFQFCGHATESSGWSALRAEGNVRHLGPLSAEELGRRMCDATVGLIPFIQDDLIRNSLPLKAYEYVACGLPVVTMPIPALERERELMAVASTPEEFVRAIRAAEPTRHDVGQLHLRRTAARANSYDGRFAGMCEALLSARAARIAEPRRFRVALLYDSMNAVHVNTTLEYLEALVAYSSHSVTPIPATRGFWVQAQTQAQPVDLSLFDVVMVHYSVRLSTREHLDERLAGALEAFAGLKLLFIQDEYEGTETARTWIERLGFDVVHTCVPLTGIEQVYPSYRFPATEFVPVLTGYVPDAADIESLALPLRERKLLIAYRGRRLAAIYGRLGQEKYDIGARMKTIVQARGLSADIEVEEDKRIYGHDWYAFLGSARATLGTESGSNIFDFDGTLRAEIERLRQQCPGIDYEGIEARIPRLRDEDVRMNQISPKVFEAIRLRTALVMFDGDYSGVVQPGLHFIALRKDFSNIDEVLAKLEDDTYLDQLTERAYRDVVASGRYSYRTFVESIDRRIERHLLHRRRDPVLLHSLAMVNADGDVRTVLPFLPAGAWSGAHPAPFLLAAGDVIAKMATSSGFQAAITPRLRVRIARAIWRLIPQRVRHATIRGLRAGLASHRQSAWGQPESLPMRVARRAWRLLPLSLRVRLVARLGR